MKLIEVKCVNPYFNDVWSGIKPFEIRFNDRGYVEGDLLLQREYGDNLQDGGFCMGYTGREVLQLITKMRIPDDGKFGGVSRGYCLFYVKELWRKCV
jgi:hypothetical protein